MEDFDLEKLKIKFQVVLDKFLLDHSISLREIEDCIIATIEGYVWSMPIQQQEIIYPKDWWQSFKDRFFPRFMLKKFPVKYTRYSIDIRAIYPELRILHPNPKVRFIVRRTDTILE